MTNLQETANVKRYLELNHQISAHIAQHGKADEYLYSEMKLLVSQLNEAEVRFILAFYENEVE